MSKQATLENLRGDSISHRKFNIPASNSTASVMHVEEKKGRPTLDRLRSISQDPIMAHQNWFERVWARPISLRITWILSTSKISPNHITYTWILLTVIAAAMFSRGDLFLGIGGVVLIQLIFILDAVDGELARYKRSSQYGQSLEGIAHSINYSLMPLSLGVGWFQNSGSVLALALGFFASVFYLASENQHLARDKLMAVHGLLNNESRTPVLKNSVAKRVFRVVPVYPTSITVCVLLSVTCIWVVVFFCLFAIIWLRGIIENLRVASSVDNRRDINH